MVRDWDDMAPRSSEEPPWEDKQPRTVSYLVEAKEERPCVLWEPLGILNKYGSKTKRLRSGETLEPNKQGKEGQTSNGEQKNKGGGVSELPATTIMRMAGMNISKSNLANMCDPQLESGFTLETSKHLLLAMCLLDAAEKFSCQQYDPAEKLLINVLLKVSGHPRNRVQKVVACFAQNFLEMIETETGKIDLEREVGDLNLEEALLDLQNCPTEQLKIFAVATSRDKLDETAEKVLYSFAESMNLPFTFRILNSEMNELRREMFELEAGEAVAVYMEFCLQSLSDSTKMLESLIREVKNLNPCVTVVSDIEADIGGCTFIGRFYETLLLCSAMFDYLEDCLGRDSDCRKIIEEVYFQEVIKPMTTLAVDDHNLKHHLKIDFWRGYFARFDVVEMELSHSSMYQASLLVRESDSWRGCTFSMNGKCMLLGWKGTPLRSLSAWKF
ncbi:scarecrow-like protein 18 [Henckelia pumila]|uniref:scarecrow-like protein 18 n=1 Tax=Henckelia pumila TaxID=405737 RepID=UPI003C6E8818